MAFTNKSATLETETLTIEVYLNVDLYCTESDHSVGYTGGVDVDGYEVEEVSVYLDEGDTEFHARTPAEVKLALAVIGWVPELDKALDKVIDKACEEAAGEYEGSEPDEPDWDCVADERRDEAREWGGMDGDY